MDNFHFMDPSEEYNSGVFSTHNEAVAKCKEIIDDFLESALTAKVTPDSLYMYWLMYGENPKIDCKKPGDFSTKQYVQVRCNELAKDHSQ